jgi:hypothetical protein
MRKSGPIGTAIMSLSIVPPETDAGIEAVGNDVSEAEVHVELQLDIGMLVQQRHELGQHRRADDVIAAGDPHRSGRLVAQRRQRIQLRLDLLEAMPDRLQKALACRRHRHAARGAREQPDL